MSNKLTGKNKAGRRYAESPVYSKTLLGVYNSYK